MRIEIINESSDRENSGEIGEIVYKGPQVTQGYLNDENKTNYVFVQFDWDKSRDIWYKSGDLGFLNESGSIECIGRKDNQIKLGGRRIEIGEIEAVLSKFTLLQDVVVVAIKNDDQITTGCVAFTMSEINKEEQMCIRQESMQHLEQVFFPKKIVTIDEFPRSPSGKINRKALSLKARSL
jgi:acyl-CoA synthetase (AMP-forming)/AMP-acid ligase II